jgi:hypothetical protein
MVIPCATANPLNSFLNSGGTLKLSEVPFSVSAERPSSRASVRRLATRSSQSESLGKYRFLHFLLSQKPEMQN